MPDDRLSFANLSNLAMLEELYQRYLVDPESVERSWRYFFEGMEFSSTLPQRAATTEGVDLRVYHLIEAYRAFGHRLATFNPIATHPPEEVPELDLKKLGFKPEELEVIFPTCGFLKQEIAPLKVIIDALQKTYCRRVGIEYVDLGAYALEEWLQKRIEPYFELRLTAEEKMRILDCLNRSEIFESFIHTKYVGQKRFSLEGAETLIPMLDVLVHAGADQEVNEIILGMAHRGRLNVLANILEKSYALIFHEFEDNTSFDLTWGTGDVKYHKGFVSRIKTHGGKEVLVDLSANPSHLESVDPVVEGQVRARQQLRGHKEESSTRQVVPVLIHGDAAIAGQGVVYETLQMSNLHGYATGGTLHIVINNQIGFTSLPKDTRSTRYCTDIAKGFGSPVFHVSAEDPEGCIACMKLALEIRQKFHCDVFIDLNCYRKYGHNESDEPTFTQPLEYQLIKAKKLIREIYRDQLIQEGVLEAQTAENLEKEFKANLNKALESLPEVAKQTSAAAAPAPAPAPAAERATAVSKEVLVAVAEEFCTVPADFDLHSKIRRLLQERLQMVHAPGSEKKIDWGMAEHLAYASLLLDGVHVRLSGQDSRRGTFSHRHAMWVDQKEAKKYFPLSHLKGAKALFDVFNSPLSEYAVLGFEFGYNVAYPNSLVIWEAQFGDFANGAQIMIDQYLSASEQKWGLRSNLVLMLPHGYEGQGPEHSSARIERFLQLCGHENMIVANCTTPAQLFHLLRRQAFSRDKKPLIIFTPKALLRHPLCVSSLEEFSSGAFQELLRDPTAPATAKRMLLCSGKIFYDLLNEREKRKQTDVAIVRIEQLYPFPQKQFEALEAQEYVWVQEEHSNMGAWDYVRPLLQSKGKPVRYAGRDRSASTAAGSYALHKKQLEELLNEAFKL